MKNKRLSPLANATLAVVQSDTAEEAVVSAVFGAVVSKSPALGAVTADNEGEAVGYVVLGYIVASNPLVSLVGGTSYAGAGWLESKMGLTDTLFGVSKSQEEFRNAAILLEFNSRIARLQARNADGRIPVQTSRHEERVPTASGYE